MSVFTNPASASPDQAQAYTTAVLTLLGDREPLDVLAQGPAAVAQAIEGVSAEQLKQPETTGKWSILQVLQHLADSELVGGWRFRLILAHDRPTITGYDQDRWAERLHYEQADPEAALEQFRVLRASNLALLKRASPEDWQRVGVHTERGEESLAQLVPLYAGHDLLHLRQIARIRVAIGASV